MAARARKSKRAQPEEAQAGSTPSQWKIYVRGMRAARKPDDPAFNIPEECIINACSTGHEPFRSGLSPFFLGPCTLPFSLESTGPAAVALNMENAWQFSKVYAKQADPDSKEPLESWYTWASKGFADSTPHRFPMGRGAAPLYSFGGFRCIRYGYIEARFQIYAPLYAQCVQQTAGYRECLRLLEKHGRLTIRDYDGYDHEALGISLEEVIYLPTKKMGHGFVLAMCLLNRRVWETAYDASLIGVVSEKAGRAKVARRR